MQLKLASVNFWGLSWPWAIHKKKRMEKLIGFIKSESFDIVCLQEIWKVKDAKAIISGLPGYNCYLEPKRSKNPSGLMIVSKHTLDDGCYLPFGTVDYEEVVFRKGMLLSDCIFPGGERLKVINTHLYTTFRPLNSGIWGKQISEIYSALGNSNTLIFGDFNFHYPHFPLPDLNVLTPVDCATRNTENHYNKMRFNRFSKINMACDLILSNFQPQIISNSTIKDPIISDHYPVSATIEI